jgi:hypothetical protein
MGQYINREKIMCTSIICIIYRINYNTNEPIKKLSAEFYQAMLKHGSAVREIFSETIHNSPKINPKHEYSTNVSVDRSQPNI